MLQRLSPCVRILYPTNGQATLLSPLLAVLVTLGFLAGCTHTSALRKEERIDKHTKTVRVLLMPVEIELAELTAGGLVEPRADWTEAAKKYLTEALQEEFARRNATLVLYEPPAEDSQKMYRHTQLIKLHSTVAAAILRHKYDREFELPTKKDKFDWTLGPGASVLWEDYQADYALFIFLRDTYSSTGRTLLSLALTALFLFPIHPGSLQEGFASLVNLHDGDIEWFNRLISYTGNLRSAGPARETVRNLLVDLPL